jgi:hypothetical protein
MKQFADQINNYESRENSTDGFKERMVFATLGRALNPVDELTQEQSNECVGAAGDRHKQAGQRQDAALNDGNESPHLFGTPTQKANFPHALYGPIGAHNR